MKILLKILLKPIQILLKPIIFLKEMFLPSDNTWFLVEFDKVLGQIGTQSALIAGFSFAMLIEELGSSPSISFMYGTYVILSVITIALELLAMFVCGLLSFSKKIKGKDFSSEFGSTLLEIWGAYSIGIVTFMFSLVFITFNKLEGRTGVALSFSALCIIITSLIYGRNVMIKLNNYHQLNKK